MIANFAPKLGSLASKLRIDDTVYDMTISGNREIEYTIAIQGQTVRLVKPGGEVIRATRFMLGLTSEQLPT